MLLDTQKLLETAAKKRCTYLHYITFRKGYLVNGLTTCKREKNNAFGSFTNIYSMLSERGNHLIKRKIPKRKK